jgi:hypothetical protein
MRVGVIASYPSLDGRFGVEPAAWGAEPVSGVASRYLTL